MQKRLEQRENSFSQKLLDLQDKQQKLYDKVNEVQEIKEKIKTIREEQGAKLEQIAKLTQVEAKDILLKNVEEKVADDLMARIKKLENNSEDTINDKAKDMLALAMQRMVSNYTVELTTTTVDLVTNNTAVTVSGAMTIPNYFLLSFGSGAISLGSLAITGSGMQSGLAGTRRTVSVSGAATCSGGTTFKDISLGARNKMNAKSGAGTNLGNNLGIVFKDLVKIN